MTRCTAHNRQGGQCKREASEGKAVCYYHGGAPGSGAQAGNQNARQHGMYSDVLNADELNAMDEARKTEGIEDEIALLRVKIRSAAKAGADLTVLVRGIETVARLLIAKHRITGASRASLDEALGRVITELSNELGLTN